MVGVVVVVFLTVGLEVLGGGGGDSVVVDTTTISVSVVVVVVVAAAVVVATSVLPSDEPNCWVSVRFMNLALVTPAGAASSHSSQMHRRTYALMSSADLPCSWSSGGGGPPCFPAEPNFGGCATSRKTGKEVQRYLPVRTRNRVAPSSSVLEDTFTEGRDGDVRGTVSRRRINTQPISPA